MAPTSASLAVKFVWSEFEKRFKTDEDPSESLLNRLLSETTVTLQDAERLWEFPHDCRSPLWLLAEGDKNLIQLNSNYTQKKITNRLEQELYDKWLVTRDSHLQHHSTLPFSVFIEWISKQARLRLQSQSRFKEQTTATPCRPSLISPTTKKINLKQVGNDDAIAIP